MENAPENGMNLKFHYANIRAFCNATENETKVEEALRFIAGESAVIKKQKSSGYHGNPIGIFEIKLTNSKSIKEILQKIAREVRDEVTPHLKELVDGECAVILRLNKQKAYEKEIVLGGDDIITVKIKLAVFKADKETAVKELAHFIATARDAAEATAPLNAPSGPRQPI